MSRRLVKGHRKEDESELRTAALLLEYLHYLIF